MLFAAVLVVEAAAVQGKQTHTGTKEEKKEGRKDTAERREREMVCLPSTHLVFDLRDWHLVLLLEVGGVGHESSDGLVAHLS